MTVDYLKTKLSLDGELKDAYNQTIDAINVEAVRQLRFGKNEIFIEIPNINDVNEDAIIMLHGKLIETCNNCGYETRIIFDGEQAVLRLRWYNGPSKAEVELYKGMIQNSILKKMNN